jgi:hypothetical protein
MDGQDGHNGQPDERPVPAGQMEGQMLITLKEGQLSIQGPIDNPLLCYALLEGARDIVQMKAQDNHRRMLDSQIVVPQIMPASGMPGGPAPGSPFGAPRKK